MKKLIILFLLLLMIYPASSLAADRTLPEEILDAFKIPAWEGYSIPAISEDNRFGGLLASYYYDENNRAAAIAIMKKDEVNILCMLEKENGAWTIVTQSSTAIKQGDEIPFVSSEEYDKFTIYYYQTDRQPVLGIIINKLNNLWLVTSISSYIDTGSLHVEINENDLHYTGAATNWEQIVVKGHIENSLELFVLDDFPLTIEAAMDMFPADIDD